MFTMMVGLPGSGKSTVINRMTENWHPKVHSSDALRAELFGNEEDQNNNDFLFKELHKRIKQDLAAGYDVIYDACNISYKRRMQFLKEIKYINCKKTCVLVATPYEQCIQQNTVRPRHVPEEAIRRMYLNFNIPQYYEGWDEIEIVWNDQSGKSGNDYQSEFLRKTDIDHENPHHTATIAQHSINCAANLESIGVTDMNLVMAAALHDMGKPFTKEYNEKKGWYTYYQHHLVGAYDALFHLHAQRIPSDDDKILETVNYIQWHMQPFFMHEEKTREKFRNLVGDKYYNNIMLLHEADKHSD